MTLKNLFVFFLLLTTSAVANDCRSFFLSAREKKADLVNSMIQRETEITALEWIQILREFSPGFVNAENLDIRPTSPSYYMQGNKKGEDWERYLHMPQTRNWTPFRNSHIRIPKLAPQNKNEFAQFLLEFAYSLQQYQINIHADLLKPLPNSLTLDYQIKKQELEAQIQSIKASQTLSPSHKTLLVIKSKLIQISYRLKVELLQRSPTQYNKNIQDILSQYDRDILILYKELETVLDSPLILNLKPYKQRSQFRLYAGAVLSTMIRFIFPFSFYKPLENRRLGYNDLLSSKYGFDPRILAKWFSDKLTAFSLSLYMASVGMFSYHAPGNIESIMKFVDHIENIDREHIKATIREKLLESNRLSDQQIHSNFIRKYEEKILKAQQELQNTNLTVEERSEIEEKISMYRSFIEQENTSWKESHGG